MDAQPSLRAPLAAPGSLDSATFAPVSNRGRRNGHTQAGRRSGDSDPGPQLDDIDLEAQAPRNAMRPLELDPPREHDRPSPARRCGRWAYRQWGAVTRCYRAQCAADSYAMHGLRYVPIIALCITGSGLWFSYQNWETLENARATALIRDHWPKQVEFYNAALGSLGSIQGALVGLGANASLFAPLPPPVRA